MPGYIRFIYLFCLLALLCVSCSEKKNAAEAPAAADAAATAEKADGNAQPPAPPETPLYFMGAQVMAQPGAVPQNLKSMPVTKAFLRPADKKLNPLLLCDGKAETTYKLLVDRRNNPAIIYDLGPLAEAAPLSGVYINVKNAAEEGRRPVDYRPFMLAIKFTVSDGDESAAADAPEKTPAVKPETVANDGDTDKSKEEDAAAPAMPPGLDEIKADIESGAYLALVKIEWRSLNGEQVALFDRPFEFKSEKTGHLLAEIDYVFGEEDSRFLDISELNLLTSKIAPGVSEPLPLDRLAAPAIAGCYRNREGKRIDIYASGMMRVALAAAPDPAADPEVEANRSPQGATPQPENTGSDRFGSWRVLNDRFLFNIGGDGELSCAMPGSGPVDFTPEFTGMQRDAACSDPWGDINVQLVMANMGGRGDITTVWSSDCDGDRRPEVVAYLKNRKKVAVLRHNNDWEAYTLWREMDISSDFRLYTDPVSGNCMLCEKDEVDGGWWINIYLSNNWYRSRRLTLPQE